MAKYKLGDICEIVSGSTPKTSIEEYWDGDIEKERGITILSKNTSVM